FRSLLPAARRRDSADCFQEFSMRRPLVLLCAGLTLLSSSAAFAQNATPHNLILFIPDGLRAAKVTPDATPAMAAVRDKGVNFKNSHSLFPTFTMANGSAMATGHRSEEHTSELQSRENLVCRLLLEKKRGFFFRPMSALRWT